MLDGDDARNHIERRGMRPYICWEPPGQASTYIQVIDEDISSRYMLPAWEIMITFVKLVTTTRLTAEYIGYLATLMVDYPSVWACQHLVKSSSIKQMSRLNSARISRY